MSSRSLSRVKKDRYRVSNWREYNAAMVKRGSITLWLDEDVLSQWHKVCGKGAVYSDQAIVCALCLRQVFRLPLRQTQGLVTSLMALMGIAFKVPHYSTLSRRAKSLAMPKLPSLSAKDPLHIAIDSTGLKLFGEGEWTIRCHGKSKRRRWRKLHLAVDVITGQLVAHKLTDQNTTDNTQLEPLLDDIATPIARVFADKAYDSFDCHKSILKLGAEPIIPPRKGAAINPPPNINDPPKTRGDAVRRICEVGRKAWKSEVDYHKRSLAETAMFRYKTILGRGLKNRTFESQQTEAKIGVHIINRFTKLGMPQSVKID